MESAKAKKNQVDDETLERMKRYYGIDSHDELLRFIKAHEVKDYNFEMDHS
jgi:hypothetical protein